MAVVTVATMTIKPGRMEDYVEVARKTKAVYEKYGGKNVRLLSAVVAGEATGTLVFLSESDSLAAGAELLEKFVADPEAPRTRYTSAGPIASLQMAFWVDVPL